jgi:protoporphyrinogen oxidase
MHESGDSTPHRPHLVIVGGGPSGLAAAYEAGRHGARATVLERLDIVGGLARTVKRGDCRYDIGPHRFFTANEEVKKFFIDIVGSDVVHVSRLTRIYYRKRYFNYPLSAFNTLSRMGAVDSALVLGSYLVARARRQVAAPRIESFEDWVVDRFGRRLFDTFFKTYTEKVWGIPCSEISAEWAAQRIKGLSLTTAVIDAFFKQRSVKTLADEFMYPRLGAGQAYEKLAARIRKAGGEVRTEARVFAIHRNEPRVEAVSYEDASGTPHRIAGDYFLCSAPLAELLEWMDPPPPPDVLRAARALEYRNHIGVKLELRERPFPDNWIYVHSPDVRMARITDYRNFSTAMSTGDDAHPLTVEYFCYAGDDLWSSSDEELVALATRELVHMELAKPGCVRSGFVLRSERAYPVIRRGYEAHIDVIRRWLDGFSNFLPIGRSGMFKYNNQDHAIATGLLAARTALGLGRFDPWLVNIDAEYHEAAAVS